jgi:hypothetical protein
VNIVIVLRRPIRGAFDASHELTNRIKKRTWGYVFANHSFLRQDYLNLRAVRNVHGQLYSIILHHDCDAHGRKVYCNVAKCETRKRARYFRQVSRHPELLIWREWC